MSVLLKNTVTARTIPFTFEGIEKLKAIRDYVEEDKGLRYPYPTLIDGCIKHVYDMLVQSGCDINPIPEYKPKEDTDEEDPLF
jgi:hypothetical protein